MKTIIGILAATAICFWSHSASAQTNQPTCLSGGANDADWTAFHSKEWRMGLSADYSSVAAGGVDFKGVKGNSGAQSATAYLTAEVPVNDAWFVPLGFISRDFFLGTVAGAPIPAQIETLGLEAGLGCRLNDQWTVAATAGPRLYRLVLP